MEKTIQRTPGNQFLAPSKDWPLVLEQHINIPYVIVTDFSDTDCS